MTSTDARLLRVLQDARARLEEETRRRTEPLAIVGIGCRFPGDAATPQQFWEMLRRGHDATREIPAGRWEVDRYFDPDPDAPGRMYVRRGGFLPEIDGFEPEFFGISPREARGMDPQQRLLLEVAWEALEDAAIAPDSLDGSATGVFIGLCFDDYARRSITSGDPHRIDAYSALGNCRSVAAGRISYVLGLRGPALQLDTSCSSSLVALHYAGQSLRSRECDAALVGGVNLISSPEATIAFCRLRALSPGGRCRTFDASADGYARGEGCGIIVLKRLSDAVAAGDRIVAVVRGSAVNHDGRSNGLTAPNGEAQERVIRAAIENAGLSPRDIGYIEAHGTGTPLGDPIEIQALARVYAAERRPDERFLVGSVKTNFGHLEGAAGVAGLIKAALAVSHGEIPPHLHLATPNPRIAWDTVPLEIPTATREWTASQPRRAGVSSFGMSGTNVHVIVEQPPDVPVAAARRTAGARAITLSARNDAGLRALAARYAAALPDDEGIADFCYTANTGRAVLECRAAVVGESAAELRVGLAALAAATPSPGVTIGTARRGEVPRVAFLFSGQGSQYGGMARELYDREPIFRDAMDRCFEICGEPLRDVIYGTANPDAIHETAWTQPALVAVEYGLATLWESWGVTPDAVLGHSVGEFTAAVVAGVLTIEEALTVVSARGHAMQDAMPVGAMAAVLASEGVVERLIEPVRGAVCIATINAPRNTVVAGEPEAIARVCGDAEHAGVQVRLLATNRAFHSAAVDATLGAIRQAASSLRPRPARIPLVSNITGRVADGEFASAEYWAMQARQAVRFGDGVSTLGRLGCSVFVEVGPTPVLLPMARTCDGATNGVFVPSLKPADHDRRRMVGGLATLFVHGVRCAPGSVDGGGRRIAIPTYPFQRQRIWTEMPDVHVDAARRPEESLEPGTRPGDEAGDPAALSARIGTASVPERRELITGYVRGALARVLGLPSADVDMRRPFHELGVDSLMLVDLDIGLRADLGIDAPVQTLAHATPAVMVDLIVRHLEEAPAGLSIDLAMEAALEPGIQATGAVSGGVSCVLLTGATGFLGAFLLHHLLAGTEAVVHCLVRADMESRARARIRANLARYGLWVDEYARRIEPVAGDLAAPQLGLATREFERLGAEADAIINNAAHVSYVSTFAELKPSHAGGTRELLRLACTGRPKRFHHVSSIAAFEAAAYRGLEIDEDASPEQWQQIHLAYSQCKWVSEAMARAARDRGVDVTIYRPSLISGDSMSGAWNTDDFLCRMLKGIVEMGAIPDGLDLLLDFSPVDYVSRALVHLAARTDSAGRAFHLNHPSPLHWSAFGDLVESITGTLRRLPYDEWVSEVSRHRQGPLYPLLPFFRQRWLPDGLTYIELNQRGIRPHLTTHRTTGALAGADIVCAPLDRALFERYFAYLTAVDFLRLERT